MRKLFEKVRNWLAKIIAREEIEELERIVRVKSNQLKNLDEMLQKLKSEKDDLVRKQPSPMTAYDLSRADLILLRGYLKSIDLREIRDEKEMSSEERKGYVARISSNWDIVEKVLKRLIVAQEEYIARAVENQDQLMFARGTVNGLMIVHEEMKEKFDEHMANIRPQAEFDRKRMFPGT